LSESAVSARLHGALEAQIGRGAPGAIARLEAPAVGLSWNGATGRLSRGESRPLRPDDAFRIASTTKNVTAVVALHLAADGRLGLDEPLADQLSTDLLERWRAWEDLPQTTPRQMLTHTAGLPNYFGEDSFMARVREEPERLWRSVDLVDHAAQYGTPSFRPGKGFEYSDTGFVVTGILVEQITGAALHEVYRELIFDPLGMDDTWLEGHEPARRQEVAHHYTGEIDWTTFSPTIDWAGGGLVTTTADLGRYVRALWAGGIVSAAELEQLTRWTPAASFPPGGPLRYDRYGLGLGAITIEGVELLGHTGFIGAFAFWAPEHEAVLVGTDNDSEVGRWPLVAALCRELSDAG
jgi:D-alanyl-D-alanine carboxypeptidase